MTAAGALGELSRSARECGGLIINADDWGRDRETTERTLECVRQGAVSAVSAMMFMEDSARASGTAQECGIDTGLHLNLTTQFSASSVSSKLIEHQQRLAHYLRRHRVAHIVFHPGLVSSFEYVVAAQLEEFRRLYGAPPNRIDGHHHAHLCSNVLLGKLLPAGTIARRNFSFRRGEKSFANRLYRSITDRILATRHRTADLFFSLPPLEPEHLQKILTAAQSCIVEVETHPVNPEEYRFLAGGEIFRWIEAERVVPFGAVFAGAPGNCGYTKPWQVA